MVRYWPNEKNERFNSIDWASPGMLVAYQITS
jgi:hypothetical protein